MTGKILRKINRALNILYIKENKIYPAYISKHNSTSEKQIILLTTPNEEKEGWHYLPIKKISVLLHGITPKHNYKVIFTAWIVFILLEQKTNLNFTKNMYKKRLLCNYSTKSKINKNKKGENVPNLEITEVVLVHYNIVINNSQRNLRVLYTFVPNKSCGQ